jgi:hypothetical protein
LPEPEPHRVTAPAPAPTKRCGSLRLRLRNTAFKYSKIRQHILIFKMTHEKATFFLTASFTIYKGFTKFGGFSNCTGSLSIQIFPLLIFANAGVQNWLDIKIKQLGEAKYDLIQANSVKVNIFYLHLHR